MPTFARLLAVGAAALLSRPALPAAEAPPGPAELARALESAWNAGDRERYLALWTFATPEQRATESEFVSEQFASGRSELRLPPPATLAGEPTRRLLAAHAVQVREPRGRVDQWAFVVERGPAGWTVRERQVSGQMDGLVHLSLDPQGFRADGLALRLPDFELRMDRGTLFMAPPELGPTLLVFVGEGQALVSPRLPTEQEQLRQFSGQPRMSERVRTAFVRLHPADLHRWVQPARFEPDPAAKRRVAAAREVFRDQGFRTFVLDAAVPGSPWWLLPGLGDAVVTFETARRGTLSYVLSSSEPEDISLFDRGRRLQILLYPSEGRTTRYHEDDGRAYEILDHDLSVRFEPSRLALEGQDTLRVRLLQPATTLRLRLHGDLQVHSVHAPETGELLFFRVRNQDTLVVALGPLSARTEPFALTVRYGGTHSPRPLEQELQTLQVDENAGYTLDDSVVYSNQTAWYPRAPVDSYATASFRFDVPQGYMAVTGGALVQEGVLEGRHRSTFRLDRPGRYYSVVLARLEEVGRAEEGGVRLRAYGQQRTRGEAARLLALARGILGFYAAAFGPGPYPDLNLVAVEGRTPGGHSPPGMVILSHRPAFIREPLRDDPASFHDVPGFFFAHELAHQWWGHGVAGENYHERWLSEGAAQYAATLWTRHQYGERDFQDVLSRLARWAIRKTDDGPIHLGQRLGHLKADPQVYRAVVYNKGAYVLHMLRQLVGGDRFLEALRDVQGQFRYAKAGSDDLRGALEKASGADLAPYFEEWVYGTRLPELDVSHRTHPQAASYRTVVDVKAAGLPGPVPLSLSVTHDQGQITEIVSLTPAGGSFTIETPGRPRRVQANADRGLLVKVRTR